MWTQQERTCRLKPEHHWIGLVLGIAVLFQLSLQILAQGHPCLDRFGSCSEDLLIWRKITHLSCNLNRAKREAATWNYPRIKLTFTDPQSNEVWQVVNQPEHCNDWWILTTGPSSLIKDFCQKGFLLKLWRFLHCTWHCSRKSHCFKTMGTKEWWKICAAFIKVLLSPLSVCSVRKEITEVHLTSAQLAQLVCVYF